jgi:large subunit ribosomal protein L29
MKNVEIKALSLEELQQKLITEAEVLRKLKFAHNVSPIENPMKIKEARRLIAKLKTELKSKELQK